MPNKDHVYDDYSDHRDFDRYHYDRYRDHDDYWNVSCFTVRDHSHTAIGIVDCDVTFPLMFTIAECE